MQVRSREHPILALLTIFLVVNGLAVLPEARSASGPTLLYSGLNFPTSFRFSPDGRIFFTEKNTGNIRVIQNGSVLSAPFASLSIATSGEEQGLLGLALSPNFSSDGFVYAYYTDFDGFTYHGRITRFTALGNIGSAQLNIFDVRDTTPSSTNHNGGYLRFGPDGMLYVQVGEFADPNQAQNVSSLAGKILRMNQNGSVPPDNPFQNSLVYAYGIRNGYGMDFDKQTGQLVETEAGPTGDDEINIIVAGGNYGWPTCTDSCNNPSFINPIASFTPIVTPTGIAYVSPRTYYFGEWSEAALEKLVLTQDSKVGSINQIWSTGDPSNGVVDVVFGPDQKLYFSTTREIYQFDVSSSQQPSQPALSSSTVVLYATIAVAVFAAIVIVPLFRLRARRSGQNTGSPSTASAQTRDYTVRCQYFSNMAAESA